MRDWTNAKSRFGPIAPVVPASASVWHEPQPWTKSSLPRMRSPEPSE